MFTTHYDIARQHVFLLPVIGIGVCGARIIWHVIRHT